MKGLLVAALVVLAGASVFLILRSGPGKGESAIVRTATVVVVSSADESRRTGPGRAGRAGAGNGAEDETAALCARIAELERDLATAQAKAAEFDALDPVAVILYSKKPLADRARMIAAVEPEKERSMVAWKFGQALAQKDGAARELLDALRAETDPKVVAVLGELLRAGGVTKATPEDRRAFAELLQTSPLAEVRAACVRAVWIPASGPGAGSENALDLAKDLNAVLVETIRTDASADVVGAIAKAMADWSPPAEAIDALKEAANRLPASPGRRQVWEAISRGTFMSDAGASLVRQFESATAQDVKDDIAAGIARAGNSMSGRMGGTAEGQMKRTDDARARFRTVYGGATDLAVRRTLLRAALYGLGCLDMSGLTTDEQKADAGRFLREIAALEPDVTVRTRIEQVAGVAETKGTGVYMEFDRIMSAKE